MYIYIRVCIRACMYKSTVFVHIDIYIHTYTYSYVYMCVSESVCINLWFVCISMCIYTPIRVYIHMCVCVRECLYKATVCGCWHVRSKSATNRWCECLVVCILFSISIFSYQKPFKKKIADDELCVTAHVKVVTCAVILVTYI